ncbi:MAG: neutral zinc metallopeptidase [Rhodanobacteraceae bacterium]
MKWRKGRRSDNVVVASGDGGQRRGFRPIHGMSLTGLLVLMGIAWLFGINPLQFLGLIGGGGSGGGSTAQVATQPAGSDSEDKDFVRVVVGSTEDVWTSVFKQRGLRPYVDPTLVLYNGYVPTACGAGQSAMGPFYCPGDQKVYLDLGFFNEMQSRFHASGDFARAYVIAHEVGHHVQNQLGIFAAVEKARRQGAPMQGAAGLSVRQELQADCFAGVWAMRSQQQYSWLEAGDIEAAMNAASAVGDDTLQKQSRGRVVPDSFTHGTSQQRQRWFHAGFQSGDIGDCDTFKANQL